MTFILLHEFELPDQHGLKLSEWGGACTATGVMPNTPPSRQLALITVEGIGKLLPYREDIEDIVAKMGAKIVGIYPTREEAIYAFTRLLDVTDQRP